MYKKENEYLKLGFHFNGVQFKNYRVNWWRECLASQITILERINYLVRERKYLSRPSRESVIRLHKQIRIEILETLQSLKDLNPKRIY